MKNLLNMDRIKNRQKLSWEAMFYSIQRIDLLIISISGAGIYVCLETLKYMFENCLKNDFYIKVSGLLFLFAIAINFISQIFGRKSNFYDYLWCEEKLDCNNKPNNEQEIRIKEFDCKSESYSKKTIFLTNVSVFLMFFGLVSVCIYFFFIF